MPDSPAFLPGRDFFELGGGGGGGVGGSSAVLLSSSLSEALLVSSGSLLLSSSPLDSTDSEKTKDRNIETREIIRIRY